MSSKRRASRRTQRTARPGRASRRFGNDSSSLGKFTEYKKHHILVSHAKKGWRYNVARRREDRFELTRNVEGFKTEAAALDDARERIRRGDLDFIRGK